jgi:hypothetical protein
LPKKICNYRGCHNIIKYTERYCEQHKQYANDRFKTYDILRRDKKAAIFYNSIEWITTREVVQNKFNHIDVYAYYIDKVIIPSTLVHHIHELKDNWDKRLDIENLIPLSDRSHKIIHEAYKKNKIETQRLLFSLMKRWSEEFKG